MINKAISIVIPAHNESQYIPGLFKSLQDYLPKDVQIIVVDNGSSDDTVAQLEKYDCKLIKFEKKLYPSTARNEGVKHATGHYLIFLDADVEITPQWAEQLNKLVAGEIDLPEHFVTGSPYDISKQPSWLEKYWFEPLSKKTEGYINGGNIITTKATFERIGGFDEALETGEDVAFGHTVTAKGIALIINDTWYVHHEGFPKTVKHFVRRESWHGKGDLLNLSTFIHSKIAIATMVFLLFHLSALVSLVGAIRSPNITAWLGVLLSLSAIIGLCFLRAVYDIRMRSSKWVLMCTLISYLYFYGRSLSVWRVIAKK